MNGLVVPYNLKVNLVSKCMLCGYNAGGDQVQ